MVIVCKTNFTFGQIFLVLIEKVRSKGVQLIIRASASHQWGLESNPAGNTIYGVSLLLVLALATKGFLWVYWLFHLLENQFFQSPIWSGMIVEEPLISMCCLQIGYLFIYFYQSIYPSVLPSVHPSPLPCNAQKSQFSLQGETVDDVRLEQNESAVRFVLCSHCRYYFFRH